MYISSLGCTARGILAGGGGWLEGEGEAAVILQLIEAVIVYGFTSLARGCSWVCFSSSDSRAGRWVHLHGERPRLLQDTDVRGNKSWCRFRSAFVGPDVFLVSPSLHPSSLPDFLSSIRRWDKPSLWQSIFWVGLAQLSNAQVAGKLWFPWSGGWGWGVCGFWKRLELLNWGKQPALPSGDWCHPIHWGPEQNRGGRRAKSLSLLRAEPFTFLCPGDLVLLVLRFPDLG